ncbi:MAG: DUF1622 domain-containing protein [marine benthic group bacterium]|nr:DUF1622 domain-containing protein [Gemmatimonadota bacterium]
MSEQILEYLEQASHAISLLAVAVIVVGILVAAVRYARRYRGDALETDFQEFKIELGRTLTLGLEILVVGDVIETITVEPTFQSLGFLAFLVVARTILSWTLSMEIEGHWPWQSSSDPAGGQSHA